MTLVIAVKVGDGVVLGADSASTIVDGSGTYINSYFNTEKLFNLRKALPIGALTFGLGGLKGRSIGSLAKDLRKRFSDDRQPDWYLDEKTYTIGLVAERVRRFFYEELYVPEFGAAAAPPFLGFYVAGYSAGEDTAELWTVEIDGGKAANPVQQSSPDEAWAIRWNGVDDAMYRILRGWSAQTLERLVQAGLQRDVAIAVLDSVEPLVHPIMPIQDAIDLVHYLMEVAIGFIRFAPGEATVARPIDIAAITKHEGFRWVQRKHYYSATLNP